MRSSLDKTSLSNKEFNGVEARISRLESIVEQIGEAVLATTETIDRLADRVDALTIQVQEQGHQVQQQGYQLFALSEAVQTLADAQKDALQQTAQLTAALQRLVGDVEQSQ